MIRDNNKDKAYFDEHIALNATAIAKRLDVETFPNVKGRVGRAYTLVHDAFIGCIYRFSASMCFYGCRPRKSSNAS